MRDHTYIPFVIISAYRPAFSLDANRARTRELEADLRLINGHTRYHALEGHYKGVQEKSFIIYHARTGEMEKLGRKYDQESILVRSGHNDCFLHFLNYADGGTVRHQYVGQFVKVLKDVALQAESFTVMHDAGKSTYWITSPSSEAALKGLSTSSLLSRV